MSNEWNGDLGLFTLWTRQHARAGMDCALEFPSEPRDAVDELIEAGRRVEEAVEPPTTAQPIGQIGPWFERRITEEVLLPFFDEPLTAVAQSAPSEPHRHQERIGQARSHQGAAYVGRIEPQPLPASSGGAEATPRRPITTRPMRRRTTGPSRYFPAPSARPGRTWSKTAILGTVLVAAGAAVLWAVLGLPMPSNAPARSPAAAPKPLASSVVSSESTSPSASASASARASSPAQVAPASTAPSASAAPAPAAPTYSTKNGPKTLDQIRAELRASGYPFSGSTDPQDLVAAYQATVQGVPAPLPRAFAASAPAGSKPGAAPASWQAPAP
ncbi:MAG: hypothetical protein KGJ86_17420, partial [Chloroflexota bacterium]|nr:hypothetical protein [Chloroflexota bacterium]